MPKVVTIGGTVYNAQAMHRLLRLHPDHLAGRVIGETPQRLPIFQRVTSSGSALRLGDTVTLSTRTRQPHIDGRPLRFALERLAGDASFVHQTYARRLLELSQRLEASDGFDRSLSEMSQALVVNERDARRAAASFDPYNESFDAAMRTILGDFARAGAPGSADHMNTWEMAWMHDHYRVVPEAFRFAGNRIARHRESPAQANLRFCQSAMIDLLPRATPTFQSMILRDAGNDAWVKAKAEGLPAESLDEQSSAARDALIARHGLAPDLMIVDDVQSWRPGAVDATYRALRDRFQPERLGLLCETARSIDAKRLARGAAVVERGVKRAERLLQERFPDSPEQQAKARSDLLGSHLAWLLDKVAPEKRERLHRAEALADALAEVLLSHARELTPKTLVMSLSGRAVDIGLNPERHALVDAFAAGNNASGKFLLDHIEARFPGYSANLIETVQRELARRGVSQTPEYIEEVAWGYFIFSWYRMMERASQVEYPQPIPASVIEHFDIDQARDAHIVDGSRAKTLAVHTENLVSLQASLANKGFTDWLPYLSKIELPEGSTPADAAMFYAEITRLYHQCPEAMNIALDQLLSRYLIRRLMKFDAAGRLKTSGEAWKIEDYMARFRAYGKNPAETLLYVKSRFDDLILERVTRERESGDIALPDSILQAIVDHVQASPLESGFVVFSNGFGDFSVRFCQYPTVSGEDYYVMSSEEYKRLVEEEGKLGRLPVLCGHSHPTARENASHEDFVAMKSSKLPELIVSPPFGTAAFYLASGDQIAPEFMDRLERLVRA